MNGTKSKMEDDDFDDIVRIFIYSNNMSPQSGILASFLELVITST